MRDQGGIIGGFVKADASFVLMVGLLQAQLDDRISQMLKVETLLAAFLIDLAESLGKVPVERTSF